MSIFQLQQARYCLHFLLRGELVLVLHERWGDCVLLQVNCGLVLVLVRVRVLPYLLLVVVLCFMRKRYYYQTHKPLEIVN